MKISKFMIAAISVLGFSLGTAKVLISHYQPKCHSVTIECHSGVVPESYFRLERQRFPEKLRTEHAFKHSDRFENLHHIPEAKVRRLLLQKEELEKWKRDLRTPQD